jgi:hypothetical protein
MLFHSGQNRLSQFQAIPVRAILSLFFPPLLALSQLVTELFSSCLVTDAVSQNLFLFKLHRTRSFLAAQLSEADDEREEAETVRKELEAAVARK